MDSSTEDSRLFGDAIDFGQEVPELLRNLAAAVERGGSDGRCRPEDLEPAIRRIERAGTQLAAAVVTAAATNGLLLVLGENGFRDRSTRERLAVAMVAIVVPTGLFLGWSRVRRRWYAAW
jgi:hypothetical protein